MAETSGIGIAGERRLLVERIASSSYFNRSARLKDLLHYLTERVIEDEAEEIREHEVGNKVFGRPANYDTTADNIVRVHASMLRKRLDLFFAAEGADEALIIEIPKGNYAPIFRERAPEVAADVELPGLRPAPVRQSNRLVWALAATTLLFAATTVWLHQAEAPAPPLKPARPAVIQFWSQVFAPNRQTDLVLDDSAVALYQELTGKQILLSEYFDRSYLRGLTGENGFSAEQSSLLVLRRQSSYANSSFLWKLMQLPESNHWRDVPRFARDYSFRELKANNAILLGNSRTNPWIQAFESRMGIRWQYDKASGVYYPVDFGGAGKRYTPGVAGELREGYCSVTMLPNLGGTGNVVIVAATGGSALNSAADFLGDERALAGLRARLRSTGNSAFPYFEALISVAGRNGLSRSSSVLEARVLSAPR